MLRRLVPIVLVLLALGTGSAPAAPGGVPVFKHVVVVVFENKEADEVVGQASAPMFASLAREGASLTTYHGVSHPSLPNYLALVSGSTQGVTNDCLTCHFATRNLADTLSAAGKTWKTYAEGIPAVGWLGFQRGTYVKRHNPFAYFDDIRGYKARRNRIVPFSFGAFTNDLAQNRLPDFSLVIPNSCHDMHDCPVATGDHWLGEFVQPLLRSPQFADSVIFVLFDEGATKLGGGGHVPALALGPAVKPGASSAVSVNHYSVLRTIENAWGLGLLGASRSASPITGIWR